jgi:tetratricopeptide (TPR) repeat protein
MAGEFKKKTITGYDRNDILAGISWLRAWCAYERGDWRRARLHLSDFGMNSRRVWRWFYQVCMGLIDLRQGKLDSIETRAGWIQENLNMLSRRDTTMSWQYEEWRRTFNNALQGAYLLAAHRSSEVRPDWTRKRTRFSHLPDSLASASWPLCAPWEGEISDFSWIPIPFDVLPRAYIEREMIDSAIASYELALKKPPHLLGPIVPRYYYRVALLYEQEGMNNKAIELYTTFLRVWGKADPIYKEPADARVRLAKLKGVRM